MSELTLGSLFDGLGGWLIAATRNGVKPIWKCEWDSNPASVAHKHFPDVKQYGDIRDIDVNEIEAPDIICAGSPCQDLSVAGKREGLDGERSGLFRNAVDIVHGLRERTGGAKPRYFVWENVPGAFSSNKGLDFKAVLEEITKADIPIPAGGRWAESGMVECGRVRVEWTVLNAARMGVPQRRKRIFLVADFAATERGRGTLLPLTESLPRNTAESRSKTEGSAGEAGCGSERTGKDVGGVQPQADRRLL